jgi:hypothetical protein
LQYLQQMIMAPLLSTVASQAAAALRRFRRAQIAALLGI